MSHLVSIIVAGFNKGKYISETIVSVLNQTYNQWELLIIDDCSTDDTVSVIESFMNSDMRIRLQKNSQNRGANYCRNKGIREAKGKYIIFLDADDLLVPACLEKRVELIERSQSDVCVFTMGTFKNQIGDSDFVWIPSSKHPLSDFLSHKLPWSILQPIWKKDFLTELTGFDESFLRLQDVELHTRALFFDNIKIEQVVSTPDCFYRIDEGRKNFNNFTFLERWIDSASKYFYKFYGIANKKKLSKKLYGTIYKAYLQLLYHYKGKSITRFEFKTLESKLLDTLNMSIFKKSLFALSRQANLFRIRIPGINWAINFCLINF